METGCYGYARPPPVLSPELAMLPTFGWGTNSAEGQCLLAICHLLTSLPIPEVYCWRQAEEM